MSLRIGQDAERFRKIVRGKIRENLKQYITNDSLMGRKGKDAVSIPIPRINTPIFRFDDQKQGGVGQGDGDVGDEVGAGKGKPGSGPGKAGSEKGDHILEVEVTMDELADILGEELKLPNIEPKGKADIESVSNRYNSIRKVGPEGLRHFKRTYKEAMKREMSAGTYVPGGVFVPRKEDKRFRSASPIKKESTSAVIIYMMDISGSMGDEQKEIVRLESFWIDIWLRKQYKGLEVRYIVHDTAAREVERDTFFRTRESGGTMISSAYSLCAEILDEDYPQEGWNVYAFHFSDGDNWSPDDSLKSVQIVKEMLPFINMFAYGQVKSLYGSGEFIKDMMRNFEGEKKVVTSDIAGKDGIIPSIKEFLGKGMLFIAIYKHTTKIVINNHPESNSKKN